MRQKFLYFVFLLLLSGMLSKAYAQTVEVRALDSFSTAKPPKSVSVQLLEPLVLTDSITLSSGDIMTGDLFDVVSPKRLKRDAGFSFCLKSYKDLEGNLHTVNSHIVASYSKPIDKGGLAKNAALGVGSFFVKGLSVGVAAVSGAVKNEEGNRVKSSAVSAYESSPLSLVEKGEDLNIEENMHFFLKFKEKSDKIKNVESQK